MGTRGALRVMIIRADGLPKADLNGKADPYVKATIRHATRETRVVHATLEPVWNEPLEFLGVLDEFRKDTLILNVCDRDVLKHDDAMGQVRVSLSELSEKKPKLEFFEELSDQGRIMFSVSYEVVPPHELKRGTMLVGLQSATDLLAADRNGLSDPYCKLSWLGQKGRSKVVYKSLAPTWDESFAFTGVLHELLSCPLRLRVYDYDRLGRDDPLGEARVELRDRVTRGGGLDATIDVELALPDGCSKPGPPSRVTLRVQWSEPDALAGAEGSGAGADGWVAGRVGAGSAREDGEETDVILLHGALMKRSSVGQWQMRWVELTGHELVYYKTQEDAEPCGVLPLSYVTRVEACKNPTRFLLHVEPPTGPPGGRSASTGTYAAGLVATPEDSVAESRRSAPVRAKALELQATSSLFGAADDARLQAKRWLRAISLLVGQQVDPLETLSQTLSSKASVAAGAGGGGGAPEATLSRFGTSLEDAVTGEGSFAGRQVPQTLLLLWAELSARMKDGLELEGIFRLSADSSEVSAIKKRLHESKTIDVAKAAAHAASGYCLAALMKSYLRELPDDLWGDARPDLDAAVGKAEGASDGDGGASEADQEILGRLSERSAALVAWCCDVCCAVTAREKENSMNLNAVAVVFAPGLVPPPVTETDPMAILNYSKGAVAWLERVLAAHAAAAAAHAAAAAAEPEKSPSTKKPHRKPPPPGRPPTLSKMSSVVAEAMPQERVKMRRVSQLAAIAGLEEGPLAAACGSNDINAQATRLNKLHDLYRVDSDRMLSKKRPSKIARDEAVKMMMGELNDLAEVDEHGESSGGVGGDGAVAVD